MIHEEIQNTLSDNSAILALLALILFGIFAVLALLIKQIKKPTKLLETDGATTLENFRAIKTDNSLQSTATADFTISPADLDDVEVNETSNAIGLTTLEPILRSLPSLTDLTLSSGKFFRITFSPEVTKGLSDGSFQLMKSGGNLKAVAINTAGKIIEQGSINADDIMKSVAVASALWQALAIVTAQKFLSDINSKLASIEEGIKRLEAWLQDQQQGQYLGNIKYLSDISNNLSSELNSEEAMVLKNQLESVYRECLQAIETNSIRANSALRNLNNKSFDGNLDENEAAFRAEMDAYFSGTSYVIKFSYIAAITEYISAVIDRKPGRELARIQVIVRNSESLFEKVKTDSKTMKELSQKVSGRFWNSKDEVNQTRDNLHRSMESLAIACDESILRIAGVSESGKKLNSFLEISEKYGLQFIIEVGENGKIKSAKSVKHIQKS